MYRFQAALWKWNGDAAWHFVTLPFDVSDDIEARTAHRTRGFGSVRVTVTVGHTTWDTSVFPDSKAEAYVLPVKAAVRKAEQLVVDRVMAVALDLVEPDT